MPAGMGEVAPLVLRQAASEHSPDAAGGEGGFYLSPKILGQRSMISNTHGQPSVRHHASGIPSLQRSSPEATGQLQRKLTRDSQQQARPARVLMMALPANSAMANPYQSQYSKGGGPNNLTNKLASGHGSMLLKNMSRESCGGLPLQSSYGGT